MQGMKERAIVMAIEFLNKAKSIHGSKVGACLYGETEGSNYFFPGFNIENRIHKGYHAEETSIINFLLCENDPYMIERSQLEGIIITYKFKGHTGVYPACASCRQYLWEFTNPDLLITVVDLEGKILFEDRLKELYPMPYPKRE